MGRLVQFLLELIAGEYYGTVTITFRKGVIGLVKYERSCQVAELPVKDAHALAVLETGQLST